MYLLGINAYHPDSSAAIVKDGVLIAACEEERFRRIKHFSGFPSESIRYCLTEAGISLGEVDYVCIPRQPWARMGRKAFCAMTIPLVMRRRLGAWRRQFSVEERLAALPDAGGKGMRAKTIRVEHHRAHLASSFFVSGFDRAFCLSADALGDFASTVWARGEGNRITPLGEIAFPHSLGFYYSAITQYLGFLKFGDEYKVMGLAAYGEPVYDDEFKRILKRSGRGFELGLEYFLHHKRYIEMNFDDDYPDVGILFSPYLEKRLGKRRMPDDPLEKRHRDIAASLQKRLEEVYLGLLGSLESREPNLCLSGGVAYNCAANGKIFDATGFRKVYIPPAAGDAGLAIGAVYYFWNQALGNPRRFVMDRASWGPGYGDDDLARAIEAYRAGLERAGCDIRKIGDEDKLCRAAAREIADGRVVGWFQGRMEWGPRALGNRSIIVDPRRKEMKDLLNQRIKRREPFRPFAPSLLEEAAGDYFTNAHPSPFMLFAYRARQDKASMIPAVVHVDGTARLQTVNKGAAPLYWKLISAFRALTGTPVVLNTSFNENEPIVRTPEEAIDCFLRTKMDVLVAGEYVLKKA